MKLTKKELITVSGGILSSYINNHYLEEAKHLGVFKHTAKKNLTRTLTDLIKIETQWFDKVYNVDEKDIGGTSVNNSMSFISKMLKFDFNDFCELQEIIVAYSLDKKRLKSISDKIHLNNGAVKL
tara:strand:- start:6717 stop:7091 length:375 start_codon:yes stop_codon:yes gene_type:complete